MNPVLWRTVPKTYLKILASRDVSLSMKHIILILIAFILSACGGLAESTHETQQPLCESADTYSPRAVDGRSSDWSVSLAQGSWSPDRCSWAGEATWSNGSAERKTHAVIEFDSTGLILEAPADLCPDGPCGPAWSDWSLWVPL